MAPKKLTVKQRYYVYALIDPRDGKPFYIGKGKGKRSAAHVREWRTGKFTNQIKIAKIAEIDGCGLEVGVQILHRDIPEALALAYEKATIARLILEGAALTNLSRGMRHSLEIAFAQVQQSLGRFPNKRRFRINILYWEDREPTHEEYVRWITSLEKLVNLRKSIRQSLIAEVGEDVAEGLVAQYGYPRRHTA